MKKIYAVLFGMFMFAACSDDNPTSGLNNSKTSTADFGEGYTYAIPIKYDEATGRVYQGTYACNYHPDTKTFAWEEFQQQILGQFNPNGDDSMSQVFKVASFGTNAPVGGEPKDVKGPVTKQEAENEDQQSFYDTYFNYETLALSNNHDGIYGEWKVTGCRRNLGSTEIKCRKYIGGLSGIARTLNITKDTIYNTTTIDLDNLEQNEIKPASIIRNNLGFDIAEAMLSYLLIEKIVTKDPMQQLKQSFSIGNQKFEEEFHFKFDKTGMNYITTLSSNGKTCTKTERAGYIAEKQCKEESAEFLLSARDKSEDELYYKEGPVEGFGIDNIDEFNECSKNLPTEETKQLLNQYTTKYE